MADLSVNEGTYIHRDYVIMNNANKEKNIINVFSIGQLDADSGDFARRQNIHTNTKGYVCDLLPRQWSRDTNELIQRLYRIARVYAQR